MSLKNTGAALSDFAQGEAIYPSTAVAATFVASSTAIGSSAPPPPHPYENFPLPPPPPHESFPNSSPLQRATTMLEFAIPRPVNNHVDPIMEEENEEDVKSESSHSLKRRSSKSGGRGGILPPEALEDEVLHQQCENDQRDRDWERVQQQPPPPPPNSMFWDYFFGTDNILRPTLADVEKNSVEREEMERNMLEKRARRREMEEKAAKVVELSLLTYSSQQQFSFNVTDIGFRNTNQFNPENHCEN